MWWQTSNCRPLLIYRPRKHERLSWPDWLTYSGRLTHIVVTHQLQVERRTAKKRWPETDVLPLSHADQPCVVNWLMDNSAHVRHTYHISTINTFWKLHCHHRICSSRVPKLTNTMHTFKLLLQSVHWKVNASDNNISVICFIITIYQS